MKRRWLCGVALGLALVTAVVWAFPRGQADGAAPLRLSGTYLQLTAGHLEWREEDWEELFAYFRELGLSELIVQWSAYEDSRFYPDAMAPGTKPSPIESVLRLADRTGMRVRLGLAFEERYWTELAKKPEELAPYLETLAQRSVAIAQALWPLAREHVSFTGWYIPQEIDDESWREPEYRQLLHDFLARLGRALHEIAPDTPVAVSGFSNGMTDPVAFEAFWKNLLMQAPQIDTVLFQDGVGAHKLDLFELPLYAAAIRNAAVETSREVVFIVELFDQVAGPPIDENPFQAVPAALPRILQQLEVAQRYASMAVAFSVPEYLSPKGGQAAGLLYDEYRVACVTKACRAAGQ
ncbi:MAG: DUF4434 domain-containing protein [Pseudomonadota bacterium]